MGNFGGRGGRLTSDAVHIVGVQLEVCEAGEVVDGEKVASEGGLEHYRALERNSKEASNRWRIWMALAWS